jgi:hypothetical protein
MNAMRWTVLAMLAACGTSNTARDRPAENIAFATSTVQTGNLGGLAGADALCNSLADDAGIGGSYVAWLSISTTTAFSRVESVPGWVAVDGTPIATQPSDLATASILSPIGLDERGHDVRMTQRQTWTATGADGTPYGGTCSDWTSEDPLNNGGVGDASSGGPGFTQTVNVACSSPRRLYCFETDRSAHVAVPAPAGRLGFVTTATWLPGGGGVPAADTQCQSEATSAGLTGTFLAVLPLPTATTASRFAVTGPNWFNTAGIPLAEAPDQLFTGSVLRGFWDHAADGTRFGAVVWGGDPNDDHAENECGGWTTPDVTLIVAVGTTDGSTHGDVFGISSRGCDAIDAHLLCLQP